MKPWEETWSANWTDDYIIELQTKNGANIGQLNAGHPEQIARARLAAAAPDMARVLLALEYQTNRLDERLCPMCGYYHPDEEKPIRLDDAGYGHAPDCALDAALRKAGVR